MAPEGTRAKTEKMKSGFLRIAKAVRDKSFLARLILVKKEYFLINSMSHREIMKKI